MGNTEHLHKNDNFLLHSFRQASESWKKVTSLHATLSSSSQVPTAVFCHFSKNDIRVTGGETMLNRYTVAKTWAKLNAQDAAPKHPKPQIPQEVCSIMALKPPCPK